MKLCKTDSHTNLLLCYYSDIMMHMSYKLVNPWSLVPPKRLWAVLIDHLGFCVMPQNPWVSLTSILVLNSGFLVLP